jgi:cytochrome P450
MHHALSRSPEARNDRPLYLDTLLKAMDESGFPFTQGDREIHALLPFVLALDTVASTLVFMLERLVRDPAWIPLLMADVEQGFSGGLPTAQTLRELPALNGFARESLRLHPTAFGMGRTAVRDFDFAGFHVRAGERVVVFTTGDHRNDAYFPDPMRFDIHRYEAPRHEHRQMAYAPFGKGPHNCLGAGLTEILLPLNMGLILQHCRIESACNMRKVKMEFKPTPVLSDNFRVRLSPRHGVSIA